MSTGLVKVIKQIAMEAVDNEKISDLRYGSVISESPLKIQVTNQFVIPESMLIVPQHLTDYEIEATVSPDYQWKTKKKSGGSGETSYESHDHDIIIEKLKFKIHNGLKIGDKVSLMRQQGGQFYLVVDRLT